MVVVGAGGHARSLIATMRDEGTEIDCVYDESYEDPKYAQNVLGVPILGTVEDIPRGSIILPAVGDNESRAQLVRTATQVRECRLTSYVSTRAVVSASDAVINGGTCVLAQAYVGPSVRLGLGCIVNTGAIVEHDGRVGSFSHVSIGATLAGLVSIGKRCFVGAGATVIDKISICDDVIIGAGTVVVSDIDEPGVYVGVPARKTSPN